MASPISFHLLRWRRRGMSLSTGLDEWVAYMPDGGRIEFKLDTGVCDRMAYIDLTRLDENITDHLDSPTMIETVRGNMEGFTLEEVNGAKQARLAIAMMGHPSEKTLNNMVSNDVIPDCDITPTDLGNANSIYGSDRASLRGKTVRRQRSKVCPEFIKILQSLFDKLREVVLVADIMFVNGLSLFVTKSRKIGLLTVEFLPSQTADSLHN
jgi:hypothetical protein